MPPPVSAIGGSTRSPKRCAAKWNRLLAFDPGSATALQAEVESIARSVAAPAEDWRGQRCGPYVLTEVAGRGGMGVVYRAERADGEVKQSAAIKLHPPGSTSLVRARCSSENARFWPGSSIPLSLVCSTRVIWAMAGRIW